MQLTGAEIIVECLKEQGVDTVFGYPGGAILNVYDALYEYKVVGINSTSNFIQQFQKQFGKTPNEFRKECKRKGD